MPDWKWRIVSFLLQDVFDPSAKLYELVAPFWEVYPLLYVY